MGLNKTKQQLKQRCKLCCQYRIYRVYR